MAELTREELFRDSQISCDSETSRLFSTALNQGFLLQDTRTLQPEDIPTFNSSQQYSCGSVELNLLKEELNKLREEKYHREIKHIQVKEDMDMIKSTLKQNHEFLFSLKNEMQSNMPSEHLRQSKGR